MCALGFGVRLIKVDISDLTLTHSWVVYDKSWHLSSEPQFPALQSEDAKELP